MHLLIALLLVTAGQSSAQQQQQQQHELRIPKLIHRNYMAGAVALQAATSGPEPAFKAHWLASCTVGVLCVVLWRPQGTRWQLTKP